MAESELIMLTAAGSALAVSWAPVHPRDKVRARRWLRGGPFGGGAIDRVLNHDYLDADDLQRDAEDSLKPGAINWDNLFKFITQIVALFSGLKP